jgi:hypothetical protein
MQLGQKDLVQQLNGTWPNSLDGIVVIAIWADIAFFNWWKVSTAICKIVVVKIQSN